MKVIVSVVPSGDLDWELEDGKEFDLMFKPEAIRMASYIKQMKHKHGDGEGIIAMIDLDNEQ